MNTNYLIFKTTLEGLILGGLKNECGRERLESSNMKDESGNQN
jgi:hypothetical protein